MPQIITRAGKGSALTHNELDANFSRTVRAVTGTDSVVASDNRNLIECNHASTPFTVTMITVALAAAEDTDGFETTFFNIGAAVASIDADGTETINGSTAAITLKQYDGVTLKLNSAGTGWDTISRVGDLGDIDAGTVNAGATTVTTFTSTGIDDNATGERVQIADTILTLGASGASYEIRRDVTDQILVVSGGNSSSGGTAVYYGGTHATLPGDVHLRSGTNSFLLWDESAGTLTIKTGAGAKTTALSLDSSQNATFAGDVNVSGGDIILDGEIAGTPSVNGDAIIGVANTAGAVIRGKGSTSDVAIQNSASQNVLTVPTGTTGVTFAGTITVGGVVQPSIPAAVAGHTRAGNIQLYSDDGAVTSSGDLINGTPAIAENTFETFGPTGSGATNIWTTLDDVPSGATMLILYVEIQARANSAGAYNIQFYTMEGDDVGPSLGDSVANQMTVGDTADAATEYILAAQQIIIPVNSSQVFHAGWSGFNQDDSNSAITMNYRGFITD